MFGWLYYIDGNDDWYLYSGVGSNLSILYKVIYLFL